MIALRGGEGGIGEGFGVFRWGGLVVFASKLKNKDKIPFGNM